MVIEITTTTLGCLLFLQPRSVQSQLVIRGICKQQSMVGKKVIQVGSISREDKDDGARKTQESDGWRILQEDFGYFWIRPVKTDSVLGP